ncbi:type II toxin-antitoxin system VapC family toxin [Methylomagnum sp.]
MDCPAGLVVDTSAMVAILLGEPDGPIHFGRIAQSCRPIFGAVSKMETLMVVLSRAPNPTEGRERFDYTLTKLGLHIADVDDSLVELAIAAFLRFGKGRHPAKLNFGDCFSYALAKRLDAPLLFKSDDFPLTDIRCALRPSG